MTQIFNYYLYHQANLSKSQRFTNYDIENFLMDEKISLKAVDQYADKYARQLAGSFFSGKQKISGQEILTLSEIRQVNLLVIRDLLNAWKKESENLRSPYFDYDAKPVAEALTVFQNTLSNHILISQNDFLPLLTRAVSQTLYLILDPYDFYSDTLDRKGKAPLTTESLKNDVKYIKINKAPLEKLVARLEEKKTTHLSGHEAFALLDSILEEVNFSPEEIDPYLVTFSKLVPVSFEMFYEKKAAPVPTVKPAASQPPLATPPRDINTVKETKPTLADNLARQKTGTLKEGLTINQKFMFTKILFHGDFEIFTEAIERLDRLDNLEQAHRFLHDAYPDWDRESEEYEEFIEIVEKRFS